MGYESRGGVAGIEYSLEELERASSLLASAGAELLDGAATMSFSPQLPAALLLVGTVLMRQRVLAAFNAVIELAVSCSARSAEAGALSLKVNASRVVYEQTEGLVTRQINDARGALLPVILMWDLATNKGRPRTDTMEDLVNQAPAVLGALLPGPAGNLSWLRDNEHGGIFDATVARRLYPALGAGLSGSGLVRLGPVEVASPNKERIVENRGALETLLDLQEIAEREPPGSLLVSTVRGSGQPVHIVTIPGTQSDTLSPGVNSVKGADESAARATAMNPWDAAGIVEGMGFGSQHVSGAVADALTRAGAKPGDKVVISGYSQGGIHAANLAGDSRFTETFDVSYVLTMGSPVALAALPGKTRALHLEDRRDMVPGTDGAQNPAGRNRVTVYFDGPGALAEQSNSGFGQAHKLANYRMRAGELAGATDPGIIESTGQLAGLLAGSGSLRVQSYQLRRVVPSGVSAADPKPSKRGRNVKEKMKAVPGVTSGWG